jgi:hypothetical protein
MSCYNWERGVIVIPSSEWASFRTELIRAWNEHLTEMFSLAESIYQTASAAVKGKRGENRDKLIKEAVARECGCSISSVGVSFNRESDYQKWEIISPLLLKNKDGKVTLTSPRKSELNLLPLTKDAVIHTPDATIIFKNEDRTVTWSVEENNRAVERAHDHWFAKKLFQKLNSIQWTRGSGGKIVGNDEYNRDSDYEGGGANYVVCCFRAPTKKEKESKIRNYFR